MFDVEDVSPPHSASELRHYALFSLLSAWRAGRKPSFQGLRRGSPVKLLAAGVCTVVANQAGNVTYGPAPAVARSFTAAARHLTTVSFSLGEVEPAKFVLPP